MRDSPAPDPMTIGFIEAMERALAAGDEAAARVYLHEDLHYRVGAQPVRTGIGTVIDYAATQSRVARWVGHTLVGQWPGPDLLVVEVVSHFERVADGRAISFPCVDIYRFREGRIYDWRVFADMSPFLVGVRSEGLGMS